MVSRNSLSELLNSASVHQQGHACDRIQRWVVPCGRHKRLELADEQGAYSRGAICRYFFGRKGDREGGGLGVLELSPPFTRPAVHLKRQPSLTAHALALCLPFEIPVIGHAPLPAQALATAGDDKSWRVRDAVSGAELACGRGHDGIGACICEQFFLPLSALANPACPVVGPFPTTRSSSRLCPKRSLSHLGASTLVHTLAPSRCSWV